MGVFGQEADIRKFLADRCGGVSSFEWIASHG
jgi:hypothetical protein